VPGWRERVGVGPHSIMVTRGGSSSSPSSSCIVLVSINQAGSLKSDHDQDCQCPWSTRGKSTTFVEVSMTTSPGSGEEEFSLKMTEIPRRSSLGVKGGGGVRLSASVLDDEAGEFFSTLIVSLEGRLVARVPPTGFFKQRSRCFSQWKGSYRLFGDSFIRFPQRLQVTKRGPRTSAIGSSRSLFSLAISPTVRRGASPSLMPFKLESFLGDPMTLMSGG